MATREYKNAYFVVKAFDRGRNMRSEYNYEDVDAIFQSTPFDKMPIVVNAYRNEYYGQVEMSGNMAVGYITGYDPEAREFSVMILEKYADVIGNYKDPIIYPRVKVQAGKVEQVLGLDICESTYYAAIWK